MHDIDPFERRFAAALRADADLGIPRFEPESIARTAIANAAPASFLGRLTARWTNARPTRAMAYLIVVLALIAALIAAAIAGGAFRSRLGRNGAIAYSVQDASPRSPNDIGNHALDYRVHLIGPDGTQDREIGEGGCPTFSTDGTVLVYQDATHGEGRLDIAAADGAPIGVVRDTGVTAFLDSEIALSPDGTQVAWLKQVRPNDAPGQTELWVTPVSSGPGVRIVPESDDPSVWYSTPVWSPDGRHVAFASNRTLVGSDSPRNVGGYRAAIDVVGSDGSDLHQITARPGTDQIGISWSPDGRFLAYVGLPDGSPIPSLGAGGGAPPASFQPPVDIFVINADGTGDRNLTQSETDELQPQWSPDGTHLAFQTTQGGGHLAVLRMDGSAPVGSPVLGPGSEQFAWAPDGTQLLATSFLAIDLEADPQQFQMTIWSDDADFTQAPKTLAIVDRRILCVPSWQWLAP